MVDLVRQLGDHQRRSALGVFLDLGHTPHADGTTAGGVSVVNTLCPNDQSRCREVGTGDLFADRLESGFLIRLVVVQRPVDGFGQLTQVVRRHVGGHTDGDTARTVGQQVRKPARQYRRLHDAAVVVRNEIDCFLIDFTQHLHGQRREPSLGVTHGSGRVVTR
ncbi:Uncharacterised protein [Mycobacteroides abscessus subsp. massiliense]|nr:Uncharacterised protein [Mycobacteroides abscessus subsp. massiliense]